MPAPEELIKQVPLFNDLNKSELQGLASSMKERQFDEGATVASEGQTGIGFFIIDEGEATVSVHGQEVRTLTHGDYFGEVALIDDGARTATITAKTPLKCYGITSWEFRPLVEDNSKLAWTMLQTIAKRLRDAEKRSTEPAA
jgi:CRP/FNR family cyclic AMP-dependent transcriptional regulator